MANLQSKQLITIINFKALKRLWGAESGESGYNGRTIGMSGARNAPIQYARHARFVLTNPQEPASLTILACCSTPAALLSIALATEATTSTSIGASTITRTDACALSSTHS